LLILGSRLGAGAGHDGARHTVKQRPKIRSLIMRPAIAALLGAAVCLFSAPIFAASTAPAQDKAEEGQNLAADEPVAATAAPTSSDVASTQAAKPAHTYEGDGIAAIVNDQVISEYELRQRIGLFLATSAIQQPSADDLKKIRAQQLGLLETEKLELQEALKKHITVSPVERNKHIDQMLAENHLTQEQLRTILANAGTNELALESQITASIAWQKTVEAEYGDRPVITPAEVDAAMARNAEGADKPHYHVAEIFLAVDNADLDAKILKNAQDIETQLQLGAPFQLMAHQFSQSPSAAAGGDIGRVYDGQLAPELNATLRKLEVNAISPPIRSVGGYYILDLLERLEPLGTKIQQAPALAAADDGMLSLARITLPIGTGPTPEMTQSAVKVAAQLRQQITSCDHLDQVPQAIKGAVYTDLGRMKLADLSPDIQEALGKTGPGEVTPPFRSEAGIELIVRCDKRVQVMTAYTLPTREEVEDQLFDEQITALARQYIRDLKRDANVEAR
jgi:peptidyl-prolyl cis-trans isomerase SurA